MGSYDKRVAFRTKSNCDGVSLDLKHGCGHWKLSLLRREIALDDTVTPILRGEGCQHVGYASRLVRMPYFEVEKLSYEEFRQC